MKTKLEFQGREITISSRHKGIDDPFWSKGYKKHHFAIKVECDGKSFKADYWQPNREMKLRNLISCFEMLCSDATYGEMSIDDFAVELCYEKVTECLRAHKACRETFEGFQKLGIDPDELGDYLRETYDL